MNYRLEVRDVASANLKRFPHVIVFRVVKDTIIIYSVFHSSRNPSRWGRPR